MKRNTRMMSLIIAVAFIFSGVLAQAAKTITVNKSGNGTTVFNSYSAALATAGEGDTIQFTDTSAVVYDESAATVVWPSADVNVVDNITVTATTPGVVTIMGRQDIKGHSHPTLRNLILSTNGAAADALIHQVDSFGTYENCTFKFAAGDTGSASLLWVDNGSATLTGCTFQDTPGESSNAILGDYTATINATDCHFMNIAGPTFRSGGAGYNVNLTRCDASNIKWRVMFYVAAGSINVDQCTLAAGSKLIETQGLETITASFKRSTLSGTEIGVNGTATGPLDCTFENCIIRGFWVPLGAYSTSASKIKAYHCVFLETAVGAVTSGSGYDTIEVKNCIITKESRGFNTGDGNMTLDEDYNLINMPGGYLAGAHDLDGRGQDELHPEIDPLFINLAAGNYHINASSPCVDKGVLTSVLTDWDGDVRPQGSAPDIGIDEIVVNVPNAVGHSWLLY